MESALIGLLGVVIGALLGEYFRRRNRVEAYSQKIFERRLEVYEGLMKRVQQSYEIASEVLERPELTSEERHALVSAAVHAVAEYTDDNALFIDEYVCVHTVAMTMGVEDISSIEDPLEREAATSRFREEYKTAKQMILEESGIHQINKHFKLVSRANPESPIIQRLKELKKNGA